MATYNLQVAETESVATIADAREVPHLKRKTLATRGRTTEGDGGDGLWVWDATSTETDDGVAIIKPDLVAALSPGRWVRETRRHEVKLRWFGARFDTPASDVSAKLDEAIDYATAAGLPLVLEGTDDYTDATKGYLVTTAIDLTAAKLAIKSEGGWTVFIQTSGQRVIRVAGTAGTHVEQFVMQGNFWCRRAGTLPFVSLNYVDQAVLGTIGGSGPGGGLLSLVECEDVAFDRIIGYDLGVTTSAGISANQKVQRLRGNSVFVDGGAEGVDLAGVKDFAIGSIMTRNLTGASCELSGASRGWIGSVDSYNDDSVIQFKHEIVDWESAGIRIDSVNGENWQTTSFAGIYFTNENAPISTLVPDCHQQISFGNVRLISNKAGAIAIQGTSGSLRPRSKHISFDNTFIRCQGRAVIFSRFDNLDLGKMEIVSLNPGDTPVQITSCKRLKGDVTIRCPHTGRTVYRLQTLTDARVALRQRVMTPEGTAAGYLVNGALAAGATSAVVDTGTGTFKEGDVFTFAGDTTNYRITTDYAGGAGTIRFEPATPGTVADNSAITFSAGKPLGGLLLETTIDGEYEIDFEGITGNGSTTPAVNLGTNASGATTADKPLILVVRRLVTSAGRGIAANTYAHLHIVGPHGERAYIKADADQCVRLISCHYAKAYARVMNTTLSTSTLSAFGVDTSHSFELDVEVEGSLYKGVYLNSPSGSGRCEVSGGNVGSNLLHVLIPSTWANGKSMLWLKGRGLNSNGNNASNYMYLLESSFVGAVYGINAELTGCDDRTTSLLKGISITSSEVVAFDYCAIAYQFHRITGGDTIQNSSKLGANVEYAYSISTAA